MTHGCGCYIDYTNSLKEKMLKIINTIFLRFMWYLSVPYRYTFCCYRSTAYTSSRCATVHVYTWRWLSSTWLEPMRALSTATDAGTVTSPYYTWCWHRPYCTIFAESAPVAVTISTAHGRYTCMSLLVLHMRVWNVQFTASIFTMLRVPVLIQCSYI